MIKETGKFIFSQINNLIGEQYARFYRKHYAELCRRHSIQPLSKEIEKAYKDKWGKLSRKVDVNNLRLFAAYTGADLNMVPEDIVHNVIEQLLNPPVYRAYYTDKNMADKIFPAGSLPKTLLRRINGFFFHTDYTPVSAFTPDLLHTLCEGYDRIILKPTVGSCSGKGVELFSRKNGTFYNTRQEKLDLPYLEKAGQNLILQECLRQSDFMARFNSSSVNTFRVLAYRSVKTNEVVIPNVIMRIGAKGSYIDNIHAGGLMVGISKEGVVNKYGTDQYGNKYTHFNNIDFSSLSLTIPDYEKLIDFFKHVAQSSCHQRVLNLDFMIDEKGSPRLIECNIDGMGLWAFHFNNGPSFGVYTDEIIEYCAKNLKQINRIHVTY